MAQQTFSGVPGTFSAGEILTASDQEKLRDFILYLIKDGDETDTGETSPLILDLGNDSVTVAGDIDVGTTAAGETNNIAGVTTASGVGSNLVVKGGDATGTNINGGYLLIKPGMGVGTGASGDIHLQTGPAGSSGTSQNTATTVLTCTSAGNVAIANDLDVDGTTNLDAVDIDGTVQIDGAVTIAGYDLTVDTNTLFVDASADRVGVGTLTPWETFDMAQAGTLGVGLELTFGTHANSDNYVSYINFHGYQGGNTQFRDLYFGNGKQGRVMYIDGSSGAVTVDGALSKGSGTFDIAHPIKGGDWRLRHSFIEGPQADLIYRGTVTLSGGTATVDLDTASNMTAGTWEALCRDPWSMAASSGNAVEWVLDGSTLTITGPADAVCNWMVIAERQDDHMKADSPIADDDGHLILEYERAEHVFGTPEPPA